MVKNIKFLTLCIVIIISSACKTEYYGNYVDDSIYIENINLNMKYEVLSIYNDVYGIVMFEECGRPDIVGSNTVIGAHSGDREDAYFNDLQKLKIEDNIIIFYNNEKYLYEIKEVKEVYDTDVNVLKSDGQTKLTLLTCKMGDISKRIIITADLVNVRN